MTRAHRIANLIGVVLPFAAFIAAIVLGWNSIVSGLDLGLLVGFYALAGVGITVGFHRLFTHRSFSTSPAMRFVFAGLGSMALEGSVIVWVSDHRKHHAYADEEGDPHSPHVNAEPGVLGALKGLWHAHVGWMFSEHGRASARRFAPDLLKDPTVRLADRLWPLWVALTFVAPFALGWAIGGTLTAGLMGLLWGGLVRIFLLHHVTWSINSVCHFFGRRRFDTDDESRNVFWLAPISFGEAWHHNHHAFPTSAFHGLRPWELDIGGLVILALEKLGLIWDVVRVPAERQRAKAVAA